MNSIQKRDSLLPRIVKCSPISFVFKIVYVFCVFINKMRSANGPMMLIKMLSIYKQNVI